MLFKSDIKDHIIRVEKLGSHFLSLMGELGSVIKEYAYLKYHVKVDCEVGSWDDGIDMLMIRFREDDHIPKGLIKDLEELFSESRIIRWTIGN